MATDTIAPGTTLTLSTPLASGTNVDFLNTPTIGGELLLDAASFLITTVASGGTTSVSSISLGGTILNFQPGDVNAPPVDGVVIQNIDSLYATLDVSGSAASENRSFDNQMAFSAESGNVFFVMPDGSVRPSVNNPTTHVDANTTLILDEIRTGLFGTAAAAAGATLEISPFVSNSIVNAMFTSVNAPINACFAAGTRILTVAGEVAVERLRVGDRVITRSGEDEAIIWIGTRDLDIARHARPDEVRPVIVEADALAEGVPSRRLVLSPDHALYLDGVLVPAKDLVNGSSIRPDRQAAAIRYYHVELRAHAVLFAEGAAAESFLDTGHRGVFDNAAEPLLLHPDLMQIRREAEGCAPLCTGGEILATIRRRLAERLVISRQLSVASERRPN